MLIVAGDQVPVIPLFEVVGKAGAVAPEHIAVGNENIGVVVVPTTTFNVKVDAHCPAVGVKI